MALSSLLFMKTTRRLRPDTWTEHRFVFDAVDQPRLTQFDSAGIPQLCVTALGAVDIPQRGDDKKSHRFNVQICPTYGVPPLLAFSAPDATTKARWLDAVQSAAAAESGGGGETVVAEAAAVARAGDGAAA